MAEDPFEKESSFTEIKSESSSSPTDVSTEPAVDTISTAEPAETTPDVISPEIGTTTDANVEISTDRVPETSTEMEETVPTVAEVWTTSTETAERRVLKEKSGEELAKKELVEESTTTEEVTTEPSTEATVHSGEAAEMEEAPFDSSSLGGLFEADGSPKVEESPTFPMANLPAQEQEEQSTEILDTEKPMKVTQEAVETTATTEKATVNHSMMKIN